MPATKEKPAKLSKQIVGTVQFLSAPMDIEFNFDDYISDMASQGNGNQWSHGSRCCCGINEIGSFDGMSSVTTGLGILKDQDKLKKLKNYRGEPIYRPSSRVTLGFNPENHLLFVRNILKYMEDIILPKKALIYGSLAQNELENYPYLKEAFTDWELVATAEHHGYNPSHTIYLYLKRNPREKTVEKPL